MYNIYYEYYINSQYILFANYIKERPHHKLMQSFLREVTAGFEPAMTVLQTGALPLGYVTIYYTKKLPE